MKTVIMAGGRGSRITRVAADIPKPMIPICGKPVLEHAIECLRRQGFVDIIITVSHLGHIIVDYFGDGSGISPASGEPFGVNIEYYIEDAPLGNAGALFKIRNRLTDDFLLLNADSIFDVDFQRFVAFHRENNALATLFTHPNNHPYDSGLIVADSHHRVTEWLTKEDARPRYYKNRVNAGLHVFSNEIFQNVDIDIESIGADDHRTARVDLDRQILKPLVSTGRIYCYDSPEYVKDMGTPERYKAVCRDYSAGRVQKNNLGRKQRAVFLDRDGTINRYVGFLTDIEEFELIDGVAGAIRKLNDLGYLVIVVTNQPVIARGEITAETLETIHNKMETELGEEGAYLNAIYYCPHHPDSGFPGEIKELKKDCSCRKPRPGMLKKAAEDYNIHLPESWMIGDGERDIGAGRAAGCRTILIGTGEYGQDYVAGSVLEAVNLILEDT